MTSVRNKHEFRELGGTRECGSDGTGTRSLNRPRELLMNPGGGARLRAVPHWGRAPRKVRTAWTRRFSVSSRGRSSLRKIERTWASTVLGVT